MIKIICFGKLKENYLINAVNDYFERINKYHKISILELKDSENIIDEEKELLKIIQNDKSYKILLDIKGEEVSSIEFSTLINDKLTHFSSITFIIGSSNGVSENIKNFVNQRISFGKITMPHGLFRAVLLEQIYRSFKILNNESYHK
ncbi:MAG: 23S rRNA (pseudouridine(1915)-N(3))-methyltransferase RlmH [Mycoplasma sp.]|nr:23S rRNA (pseudouridine(1915)-N(3))-methyltransferase RlmH [Mycoplasma sp.]MDY4618605.1 23S rRNA (pseudouridine(1915)-N(3))-methyltransferase RlmH [Bacilli bacterium]